MKAKITIVITALIIGGITPANADLRIQSPVGLTQAQWNATDTYKNFTCPNGFGRGEGVDMNYTTTQTDDVWYVTCEPYEIFPPFIMPTVSTTPVPVITETVTVTVTPNINATVINTDTATVKTETQTATIKNVTVSETYAEIMALLTRIFQLLAILNR
jgi:hypothetical protein